MSVWDKIGKAVSKPFHSNTMKSVLPTALATVGTLLGGSVGGAVGGAAGSILTGGNTMENIGAAAGGSVAGIGAYAGQKTARNMFGKAKDSGDSTPDTTSPEQKIVDAKADSLKRRRKLYATSGGSLGEEVESVGDTFGNGRGLLFGN